MAYGVEREAGLVVRSWYPELDEILDGFAPGEVALVISSSEFEEGHFGPLGAEFAMHMAYEAGLAKARVTVASLAVEADWAAEWLKAEALLHDQGKVIDAMLGNGEQDDRSDSHSGNMIIHGDNLEALKALLPEYECSWASPWRPWR